jgi:serine protease Do
LTEELSRAFGLKDRGGALVANVEPGSPAAEAGMKAGDVVVKVGGKALRSSRDIYGLVAALEPGRTVPFVVVREKKERTLKVVIGQPPGEEGAAASAPGAKIDDRDQGRLGISVAPLDERARRQLQAKDVEGVLVTGVDQGSKASKVLSAGDVITEVNRERVADVAAFEKATSGLGEGDDLLLLVFRKGAWIYQIVRL